MSSRETPIRAAEHLPAGASPPVDLNLFLTFAEIVEVGTIQAQPPAERVPFPTGVPFPTTAVP